MRPALLTLLATLGLAMAAPVEQTAGSIGKVSHHAGPGRLQVTRRQDGGDEGPDPGEIGDKVAHHQGPGRVGMVPPKEDRRPPQGPATEDGEGETDGSDREEGPGGDGAKVSQHEGPGRVE